MGSALGFRYTPGQWTLVCREDLLILVDPDTPDAIVDNMWTSVESGADASSVLDHLTRRGLRELPGFALVCADRGRWRIALRGDVSVDRAAQGSDNSPADTLASGADVIGWTERTVEQDLPITVRVGVTVQTGGPRDPRSPKLPIRSGVVRVAEVSIAGTQQEVGLPTPGSPATGHPNPTNQGPALIQAPPAEISLGLEPKAATAAAEASPAQMNAEAPPAALTADPEAAPVGDAAPATALFGDPNGDPNGAGNGLGNGLGNGTGNGIGDDAEDVDVSAEFGHLYGATRLPKAAATVAEPTDGQVPGWGDTKAPLEDHATPAAGDHDGMTALPEDIARIRAALPPPREAAGSRPPRIDSPPPVLLRFSTGETVPLDRTVVIGRAPRANRIDPGDLPRLISVASPQHDVSRSHVEIRPAPGSASITDLNSTNGTVVITHDGDRRHLEPGASAVVESGGRIDLGDGVVISVDTTEAFAAPDAQARQ